MKFVRFPAIQEYLPHQIPASIIAVDEAGFPTEIKYHQFNIGAEDRSITDPDFEELYELLVGIREDEAYKTCFHLVGQTLSQQVIIPPELKKIYDTSIDRINVHPTYEEGCKESPMLRLNALLNPIHIYTEYHARRIDAFGCIISDTVSAETVANALRINDIMIERELETGEYLSFIDFYEFFQVNEL